AHKFAGDAAFSTAMRDFYGHARRSHGPYMTSHEMFEYIIRATPDSLSDAVRRWFTTVTTVHASITNAVVTRLSSGTYAVDVSLRYRANRFDTSDVSPLPISESVEIGISVDKRFNNPQRSYWVTITGAEQTVRLLIDANPVAVILDPWFLLPDQNRNDNSVTLSTNNSSAESAE
ncbi:MAG: hypothetical protein ACOYNS_17895, partial [Bacteroidota bacterium]